MNEPRIGRLSAPPFSREQIIDRAQEIIARYAAVVGKHQILQRGLCFRELYEEVIYPDHEVELIEGTDLGYDTKGRKLLGMFDVEAKLCPKCGAYWKCDCVIEAPPIERMPPPRDIPAPQEQLEAPKILKAAKRCTISAR